MRFDFYCEPQPPKKLTPDDLEPIAGYEGLYGMDTNGRVYTFRRNHWMKYQLDCMGVRYIYLLSRGKKRKRYHRALDLILDTIGELPRDWTRNENEIL